MAEQLNFQEMLSYMRPEGSQHQSKFCNRYLRPVFGLPDKHGNYTKIIGDKPSVAFMAHHDTVHRLSGKQTVKLENGFYSVENSNCLGADCTTGIYIILKMIEAGISGVYVIHAAEESGCIGSSKLVKSNPDWFSHVKAAVSFDRKGYESVVTHQMGVRTCSDDFANSLANILDLQFKPDAYGVYTDSNEYRNIIPECTNLSVGYFNQHTSLETQDKVFLDMLIEKVISADWSKLVISRDPSVVEDNYKQHNYSRFGRLGWETEYDGWDEDCNEYDTFKSTDETVKHMADIIKDNPIAVATMLRDLGYDAYDLIDDIEDYKADIRPSRGFS